MKAEAEAPRLLAVEALVQWLVLMKDPALEELAFSAEMWAPAQVPRLISMEVRAFRRFRNEVLTMAAQSLCLLSMVVQALRPLSKMAADALRSFPNMAGTALRPLPTVTAEMEALRPLLKEAAEAVRSLPNGSAAALRPFPKGAAAALKPLIANALRLVPLGAPSRAALSFVAVPRHSGLCRSGR